MFTDELPTCIIANHLSHPVLPNDGAMWKKKCDYKNCSSWKNETRKDY
jgi:hypothetical protein